MLYASPTASWMDGLSERAGDTVSTNRSQALSLGFPFFTAPDRKPKRKSVSKMEKKKREKNAVLRLDNWGNTETDDYGHL
jgi:hypothetical protein